MSELINLRDWAVKETDLDGNKDLNSGFWKQILFVRDDIEYLFIRDSSERCELVRVYNAHNSKGAKLPVYQINLPQDGITIWMRDNWYDWNISIQSERPITCDFIGLFDDEYGYPYCFCQGMEDKKFGMYKENNKEFTICITSNYDVYCFFRILKHFLGVKYKSSY